MVLLMVSGRFEKRDTINALEQALQQQPLSRDCPACQGRGNPYHSEIAVRRNANMDGLWEIVRRGRQTGNTKDDPDDCGIQACVAS